jgi:hypothetical protein
MRIFRYVLAVVLGSLAFGGVVSGIGEITGTGQYGPWSVQGRRPSGYGD